MLLYREDFDATERVYEVTNINMLPPGQWMLKVKESGLLRVQDFMRDSLRRVKHRVDKVALGVDKYDGFVQNWISSYCAYNHVDSSVVGFFRGIMALLENQIILAYLRTLTTNQTIERMLQRPIRVIEKPKNVEQFTLTEGGIETETRWQSLKVTAFQLKYYIEE